MNLEEQIMSKDKYPSIFSKSNGGYCQLGNIRSGDAFRPIARERK